MYPICLKQTVTIHRTIKFYDYFGCVTIVKNIHYGILEYTRIVHVFSNVELWNKHLGKTVSIPLMPQLVVTNT